MSLPRILLVDDDPQALESTRKILELSEYEVACAQDGQDALDLVRKGGSFDVILTDVRMPRMGGLDFLRALNHCGEDTPVILMTAFGRVEDAVWAMKFGAVDFIMKPFKRQALLAALDTALKRARSRGRLAGRPVPATAGQTGLEALVGRSPAIRHLRETIARVAPTSATVLISGESGTGKELIARCLHEMSPRAAKRMVALNCAAIPDTLIESELFGYEKGAFTGATVARVGLLEAADGGTLFLDEVGEMPILLQAKLLRVLQDGEVRRVGGTTSRRVDARIITATNRDLRAAVTTGRFREDLLYRLEVIAVTAPPLRERIEDVPELAYHFLRLSAERHGKAIKGLSEDTLEALLAHPWPGNVRELANVIERGVVLSAGEIIEQTDLPAHLASAGGTAAPKDRGTLEIPIGTSLREAEDLLIQRTLEVTDGDRTMTARLLGINARTIYRRLGERKPEPENSDS